ncbi:hypothetical protein ACFPM0_21865 [Pseudonocardia sulfidoxydans]
MSTVRVGCITAQLVTAGVRTALPETEGEAGTRVPHHPAARRG